MKKLLIILLVLFAVSCKNSKTENNSIENSITSDIVELTETGIGNKVGTITVKEEYDGILITVEASGLKPGIVGFHLHEKNDPSPTTNEDGSLLIGGGLGGHWDPDETGIHAGPDGNGHRGDLDALTVDDNGNINQTVESYKIKYNDIAGKSFVIHASSDNYTDEPVNGGSGARVYTSIF